MYKVPLLFHKMVKKPFSQLLAVISICPINVTLSQLILFDCFAVFQFMKMSVFFVGMEGNSLCAIKVVAQNATTGTASVVK